MKKYNKRRLMVFTSRVIFFSWVAFVLLAFVFIYRELADSRMLDWAILPLFIILGVIVLVVGVSSLKLRCLECDAFLFREVRSDLDMNKLILLENWAKIAVEAMRWKDFSCPHCGQEYTLK